MTVKKYDLDDLRQLMRRLRDPAHGCPWDLKQTFQTIVPHTLEECYELADAIERGEVDDIRQELGDVLFQVIFYSQLGEEGEHFDFDQVVHGIVEKLLRRHPHVFIDGRLYGDSRDPEQVVAETEVHRNWEQIKDQERQARSREGILDDIPLALPALVRAGKLQKRAARAGFDWDNPAGPAMKVREELAEVEAVAAGGDAEALARELGDLMFSCVNLARHYGIDAETALRSSNHKFEARFRFMEAELNAEGKVASDVDLDTLEGLWQRAKSQGL